MQAFDRGTAGIKAGLDGALFKSEKKAKRNTRKMSKKSHHFRGIERYAEQLMDLAEGRPVFSG